MFFSPLRQTLRLSVRQQQRSFLSTMAAHRGRIGKHNSPSALPMRMLFVDLQHTMLIRDGPALR